MHARARPCGCHAIWRSAHNRVLQEITDPRGWSTANAMARLCRARASLLRPVGSVQLRPSSISAHDTRRSARLGGLRTACAGVCEALLAACGLYSLYRVPGVYAGQHTCMSTLWLGRQRACRDAPVVAVERAARLEIIICSWRQCMMSTTPNRPVAGCTDSLRVPEMCPERFSPRRATWEKNSPPATTQPCTAAEGSSNNIYKL